MWSKASFRRWIEALPLGRGRRAPCRLRPTPPRLLIESLEDRTAPAIDLGLVASQVASAAQIDFAGLAGQRDGRMARVGYDLTYLYHEFLAFTAVLGEPAAAFTPANTTLRTAGCFVAVDVLPTIDPAAAQPSLNSLGFVATARSSFSLHGWLPITSLDDVAALPGIRAILPAYRPVSSVGLVDSQGVPAQRSDRLARFLGLDGSGITVGVLSDSYDMLGGADSDIAGGDLPGPGNPFGLTTPVNVLGEGLEGDTDEGRAMLQIVHDVAPGANLAFASAGTNQSQLAANIFAMANSGASVIVDDVTFPAEPMFQDGIVAQAVNDVVATGVAYFSAAGNLARNSYEQAFRNSGVNLGTGAGGTGLVSTSANFIAHDFDPGAGVDLFQTVTLPAGVTTFSFQWAEPFFSVSGGAGAQSDLDVAVFDMNGNFLSSIGGFTSNLGGDPVEVFQVDAGGGGQYQLAIGKFSGPDPGRMKYVAFRPEFVANEYATNSSTVFGHANAAGAAAVGAVAYNQTPAFGVNPPVLESFSSRGGTQILFDSAGNPIAPETRPSVRFVAPDGANTTFFGTDIEPDGYPNFIGTSAAAPHAAALAVLLLQANSNLTPAEIYSALGSTAIDMGPPGYDPDTGFGLVQAPEAVYAVAGPFPVTFDGTDGNDSLLVRRSATGSNIEFLLNGVLRFSLPASEVADITVNGLGGSDTLTVDSSNGDPVPSGGLAYFGGENSGDADRLVLTGYNVPSLVVTHTDVESGTIAMTPGVGLVSFEQTESLTLAGTAAALEVRLPQQANPDVVIGDDGGAGDPDGATGGYSAIRGSTFSFTQFTNPTNSLAVVLGGGDTVAVQPMDGSFAPGGSTPFRITGSGADSITVFGSGGDDAFTFTPKAERSADIERSGPGPTLRLSLVTVGSVTIDGLGQSAGDTLSTTAPKAAVFLGSVPGTGTIHLNTADGSSLLVLNYRNLELPAVAATVVSVPGTIADDVIEVSSAGRVSLARNGGAANAVAVTADELYVETFDGTDQIAVASDHPFRLLSVVDNGFDGSGSPALGPAIASFVSNHLLPGTLPPGDTLLVSGGGPVAFDLPAGTVTTGTGTIAVSGIETFLADAGSITVAGGPGATNVGLSGDAVSILSPGAKQLFLVGSVGLLGTPGTNDWLLIRSPGGAVRVPGDGSIDLGGLATLHYDAGIDALHLFGTSADDVFEVAPLPIFVVVDGSGQTGGDRLAFGGSIAFVPTPGQGTIPTNPTVEYFDIELFTMGAQPAAAADTATGPEGTTVVLDVLANDTDLDDGPLTLTIITPPMFGTAVVENGQIVYTPVAGYNSAIAGPDSLTYRIVDANGDSSTATVSISITAVDSGPVAGFDSQSVAEDGSLLLTLTGDDHDPEVDRGLTFAIVTPPSHGTLSGFNPATGTVRYTPFANYNGPDAFTFTVTDAASAGLPAKTSTPATVFLQVIAANDPPTPGNDQYTVREEETLRVGGSGVLLNDSDPDGDPLTLALVIGPSHGTLTLNPNGSFTYLPRLDFAGTDSFVYRVSDGRGGMATATATIIVTPVPDDILVTGAGQGGGPHIMVFDARTGGLKFSFFAYDASYRGGVRVAVGDVNADGVDDIITGTGPGGFPHVKVFDGRDLTLLASFFGFDMAFLGGISVAAGDLDGLPGDEVVVAAGPGCGPHVRSFKIIDGKPVQLDGPLGSFFAFEDGFIGGVNVAVGNYDGLPGDEVIVGAASLGGPHIKVLTAGGKTVASFFAFPQSSLGVSLAMGDVDGDGRADIITGPAVGGGPIVRVFAGGTAKLMAEFPAFDPDFRTGISVGAVDRNHDNRDDLLVAPAEESRSLQVFDGNTFSLFEEFDAFDSSFPGGVFVGGKSPRV